jgi:hypothetical protein
MVGPDAAIFRDVMVMGGASMSGGSMASSGSMGSTGSMSAPASMGASGSGSGTLIARDGRQLSTEPAATQALFMAVWGNRAAVEWAAEHNTTLPQG